MKTTRRSEMLRARVTPQIKLASEDVLRRMGMTMTEAIELFLRELIAAEQMPFAIRAVSDEKIAAAARRASER